MHAGFVNVLLLITLEGETLCSTNAKKDTRNIWDEQWRFNISVMKASEEKN